jgi:formylmethanofuran dehydrogenase subunit E
MGPMDSILHVSQSSSTYLQEGNMRSAKDQMESKAAKALGREEVRCSQCGTKLKAFKDQIETEDSIICSFCYQSMVFHHRAPGIEMCD